MFSKRSTKPTLLITCMMMLLSVIPAGPAPAAEDDAQLAQEKSPTESNDALLMDLLETLDEETEIATKTKINIDFVPGMVSVLHGNDLLNRGALTVYDALALLPGVEVSMTNVGQPQIIFRGTGKTFASSNAKLLLDGVAMNSTLNAQSPIFSLPIEQVDRIEVIRGPGSSIYGEFAFAGVIDVITRKDQRRFFARTNGFGAATGGVWSYVNPYGVALNLNASATDSTGSKVEAGADKLYGKNASDSPGPTNESHDNEAAIARLDYKSFSLQARHIKTGLGDHFGINDILPPPVPHVARTLTDQCVETRFIQNLSQGLNARFKLGWSRYELDSHDLAILPDGFKRPDPANPGMFIVFPDGAVGGPHHVERKYYGGFEINYTALHHNDMLLGVDVADIKQTETWVERNYSITQNGTPLAPIPLQRFTGDQGWLQDGLARRIFGAYLQDQYTFGERLMVTGGVRYDDYSDVGSNLSPRIAAVYRLGDAHTVKLQLAEAFRPPTFIEMFTQNNPVVKGNPDIHPEKLKSQEAGYIYNNGSTIARLTFFHLELDDLIVSDLSQTPGIYRNVDSHSFLGSEVELIQQLNRIAKFNANMTYLDRNHDKQSDAVVGLASFIANAGVQIQPTAGLSLALQYRHVGERQRAEGDSRPPLDGYNTVDMTLSLLNVESTGLTIRTGISNLFDERVVFPAPAATYVDDYPRPGATGWIQFTYEL